MVQKKIKKRRKRYIPINPVVIHINTRGCVKKMDKAAVRALAEAVHKLWEHFSK